MMNLSENLNPGMPVAQAISSLTEAVGGEPSSALKTKTEALKEMYVALGGEESEVESLSTISQLIQAITAIASPGGGGSAGNSGYERVAAGRFTFSTTSTSVVTVGTINVDPADIHQTEKLIYVKIRDLAGKKNGYFYGSDQWFVDLAKANNGNNSLITNGPKISYMVKNNGQFDGDSSTNAYGISSIFGVYVSSITAAGVVNISAKASSGLIIDGEYQVDVYLLDWPDDISPLSEMPLGNIPT